MMQENVPVFNERRKTPRIPQAAHCEVPRLFKNRRIATDISLGGLRIKGNCELDLGEELCLRIWVSTEDYVSPTGKIVWRQQHAKQRFEYGIVFNFISEVELSRLAEFLEFQRILMEEFDQIAESR